MPLTPHDGQRRCEFDKIACRTQAEQYVAKQHGVTTGSENKDRHNLQVNFSFTLVGTPAGGIAGDGVGRSTPFVLAGAVDAGCGGRGRSATPFGEVFTTSAF